jgi:hypothetical protein
MVLARPTLRWYVGAIALSALVWLLFVRAVVPVDLDVFLAAGRTVAAGHDPYPPLGAPAVWSGSAFVYPWLTAWLFAVAAVVSTHAAAIGMATASLACVAFGVRAVSGPKLAPLACVLLASPTLDGLQIGTLNALLFLGVCLAWRWRDRALTVGVIVGVLVMLKLVCWPLAVWLLLTHRFRAAATSAVAASVLLGAGWVFGPLGLRGYARMLSELSTHEAGDGSGLQSMLVRAAVSPSLAQIAAFALAAALFWAVARRGDAAVYSAAVVAALLISPVVWHHYYLLLAAPLLLVRRGVQWYWLVGWASTSARSVYGVSWLWISVAANVVLAALVLRLAWQHRHALRAPSRRAAAASASSG